MTFSPSDCGPFNRLDGRTPGCCNVIDDDDPVSWIQITLNPPDNPMILLIFSNGKGLHGLAFKLGRIRSCHRYWVSTKG